MINQLNPVIPNALFPVEVDKAIIDLQLKLETNLSWLTNAYGRSYRFQRLSEEKKVYYPEIYIGVKNLVPQYLRMIPDSFKKGTCFFIVGKEEIKEFSSNSSNLLEYNISIIFQVNLDLINKPLLQTEVFTQNLIKEVRNVLTNKLIGTSYMFELTKIEREFMEVYREFSLDELNNYNMAPYDNFRVNGKLKLYQECDNSPQNYCDILNQNISQSEILTCLLPTLDFSNDTVFNSLSAQQKADLITKLI